METGSITRYKYLPFNDGSLCTITDGTIKFTCPLEFNDPFDCRPEIDLSSIETIPRERPDLWKIIRKQLKFSPSTMLQQKGKILKRMHNDITSGNHIESLLERIGVCSVSRDPLNILMWSHYAQHHKGFVLEFQSPTKVHRRDLLNAKSWLIPLEVVYSKNRPIVPILFDPNEDHLEKHLLTKSIDWSYEQEERILDEEHGPGVWNYDRAKVLQSVLCGMRMSEDNYLRLRELVETLNRDLALDVGCYRVEQIPAQYALTIPGHPTLDQTESS